MIIGGDSLSWGWTCLNHSEVLALLPVGDVSEVAVKLRALDSQVPVDYLGAECRAEHVVGIKSVERVAECPGQAVRLIPVGTLGRRPRVDLPVHAVEPGDDL